MASSWQFKAGARAGFGHEAYSEELYNTYPAYRAGYTWASHKARKSREDKHIASIAKEKECLSREVEHKGSEITE